MSDHPYINFYTSDFLGGTSGMTAATKGVYITLLCLMYEADGPLPQKWDTLARRCGCTLPAFKRAVQDLVDDGKITILDAGIWSEKCDKHITQRCERRSSAAAAAKERWKKIKEKQGKGDAAASSAQCQPEPEPEIKEEANASSKKPARGTRLPPEWVLPREWGEWALSQQIPEPAVRIESEKFRDYWHSVAGQKGVKLDWYATWRNWIRNANIPKVVNGGRYENTSKSRDRLSAFVAGARGAP